MSGGNLPTLPVKRVVRPTPSIPDHEVVRQIGSGAYGEVWLGKIPEPGRGAPSKSYGGRILKTSALSIGNLRAFSSMNPSPATIRGWSISCM